jgi:vitamin B12 transporter
MESLVSHARSGVAGLSVALLAAWCTAPHAAQPDSSAQPEALQEVTVTASKTDLPIDEMTQAVTVITQAQIRDQAQVDMNDVLRGAPGVQIEQGDVPGEVVHFRLRGLSDSTLYVFDGITLNAAGSGDVGYLLGQIDPSMIGRIEILRGPQTVLYGANSTSGVVDLSSLSAAGAATEVAVEAGSVDWKKVRAATQDALPLDDGTLRYSVDGSWTASDGMVRYEYTRNATLVARLSYQSRTWELGGSLYGTDNEFQNADLIESLPGATASNYFAAEVPDPSDVDRTKAGIASLWAVQQLTPALSQKLTVGAATEDFSIVNGDTANDGLIGDYTSPYDGWVDPNTFTVYDVGQAVPVYQTAYDYKTVNTNQEADYNLRYRTGLVSAVLGATYLGQIYAVSGTYGGSRESESTRSAYADAAVDELGGALHLELGARLDSYSAWRSQATYSMGAAYRLPAGLTLYANYGTSFTEPTLDELDNPAYGNRALTPESGSTVEGGLRASELGGRITGSITVWHSYIDHVITYDYGIYNPLAPGDYGRYDNSEAERTQGLELEGRWRITSGLELSGNYTYTDAHVTNAAGIWNLMTLNARDFGNLQLDYRWRRFDVGTHLYATSRRLRWAGDVWAPGYARLDVYGRLAVTSGLDVYLRIQNVLDRRIVEILGYENPGLYAVAGAVYRFR